MLNEASTTTTTHRHVIFAIKCLCGSVHVFRVPRLSSGRRSTTCPATFHLRSYCVYCTFPLEEAGQNTRRAESRSMGRVGGICEIPPVLRTSAGLLVLLIRFMSLFQGDLSGVVRTSSWFVCSGFVSRANARVPKKRVGDEQHSMEPSVLHHGAAFDSRSRGWLTTVGHVVPSHCE